MISTRFLPLEDYQMYRTWLLEQDQTTLKNYFGTHVTPGFVDNLMHCILENAGKHYFLIASDRDEWLGVLHMATHLNTDIEFGIIVKSERRGQGIADQLMDEAVTWAQNRRYKRLYLHCLSWNQPIKHLCHKYGLTIRDLDGSGEVDVSLPPPSMISVGKEIMMSNRNIFAKILENNWDFAK